LSEISRKENEEIKKYKLRLFRNKDTYNLKTKEIGDLINKETENNFNESTYRKWFAAYEEGYTDAQKEGFSDDKVLKELTLKQQELQKEKIKVQTEKLGLNQALREEARFELTVERLIDAIKSIEKPQVPTYIQKTNNPDKSGALFFGDCHYDKELEIKGLRGEILNKYNTDIFEKRMWNLLNKTKLICEKEGFTEIYSFLLGDELEGMLRISQLMTLKYGITESAIRFARFISTWYNELSKYVRLKVFSTYGNHTDLRVLTGKKGDFPHENISKIINELVKEILRDNPNIEIIDNETDKIYTNIQGYNILGIHGEEKNIQQSIKDYSYMYNEQIDYIVSGHKHHANSESLGIRKGCIGVGSIIGIDDFSMDLKRMSDPSATFVVFEEGYGKTLEYNIILN